MGGAGEVSILSDGPLSTTIKFDKEEVNQKIKAIRDEVNRTAREHIKQQLAAAAHKTGNDIANQSVRERAGRSRLFGGGSKSSAAVMVGNSLGYHFKHATKDRYQLGAGSYDRDEGLNMVERKSSMRGDPTGIRAKGMKKSDPSLTAIYERTSGPFEVTGIISDAKDTGFVRPGELNAKWKQKNILDWRGAAFYAMKGYGKNQKRKDKSPPKVMRKGWKGLNSISRYERNFRNNLNGTAEMLKRKIENITIPESGGRQTTLGEF
tara:strand:+ start:259 stop:1050 length:792 start_codon:yes stop_codon:yes gene_type:complete